MLYNSLQIAGDNSDQLCKLCIGKIPGGRCTTADPYAGYEGAFRCLVEAGEIAFLVHTTVDEMTSTTFDFGMFLLVNTLLFILEIFKYHKYFCFLQLL